MDTVSYILDEAALVVGVLAVCIIVIKIQAFRKRNWPKRPEAGTGYLSSFSDDDKGYRGPHHKD